MSAGRKFDFREKIVFSAGIRQEKTDGTNLTGVWFSIVDVYEALTG